MSRIIEKITKAKILKWFPVRSKDVYKNQLGRVLCIGGNQSMGGAILLAGSAALSCGAGLVTIASHPVNLSSIHARHPEIMYVNYEDKDQLNQEIKQSDIILIGPGLGREPQDYDLFLNTLNNCLPHQKLIIDADGLYHLTILLKDHSDFKWPCHTIITPHLGEWERLTKIKPPAEDITLNKKWRDQLDVELILKKERTEIYLNQQIWKNTAGNPAMATGGMGDTLAGIIAGLVGQHDKTEQAILMAVYLHSYCADQLAKNHYVTLPSEVIKQLPRTMAEFRFNKENQ